LGLSTGKTAEGRYGPQAPVGFADDTGQETGATEATHRTTARLELRLVPSRRRLLRFAVRTKRAWNRLPDLISRYLPATPEARTHIGQKAETDGPSRFSLAVHSRHAAAWLGVRTALTLRRLNRHPNAIRLSLLLMIGATSIAAAAVIARNALEASRQAPIARVFNPRLAEQRHKMTIERAELIRRCLHAYSEVHGHPPASLSQLVPEFLPGIPRPLNGAEDWNYIVLAEPAEPARHASRDSGQRFELSFRSWAHPTLRREAVDQDGRWTLAE
jgi:hypothetical protein